MKQKRRKNEEIARIVQGMEAKLAGGKTVEDISKELGVSVQTLYAWRRKYAAAQGAPDQAKQVKGLREENALLRRLVADQAVEILRLKEALAEI